jgi:hypothetical protein
MELTKKSKIIGVPVPPIVKKRIIEEAEKRGLTQTDFIFEIIEAGWDSVVKQSGRGLRKVEV